jgi:GT2 family glycosyltransferase
MYNVDVVIVNWNAGSLLFDCLDAVSKSSCLFVNAIVVDNASTDSSLIAIDRFSDVEVIKLKKNIGFAEACNIGWRQTNSDFVLFLNPDTRVGEHTIRIACSHLATNPCVNVVGVQYLDSEGSIAPSCSRFPRSWNYIWDVFGLSKLFPRLFMHATVAGVDTFDYSKSSYVDEVSGAFYLIRRSDLIKFDGFDERFFVYYEELDLSKRIIDAGGKVYYLADTNIVHIGGGTTNGVKGTRLFYELRSRLLYSKKHFNMFEHFVIVFVTMFEFISRCLYLIMKRRLSECSEILFAYTALIRFLIR